jgi:hypothetical protein
VPKKEDGFWGSCTKGQKNCFFAGTGRGFFEKSVDNSEKMCYTVTEEKQ